MDYVIALGFVAAVLLLVWGIVEYVLPLLATALLILCSAVAVGIVLAAILGVGRFFRSNSDKAHYFEYHGLNRSQLPPMPPIQRLSRGERLKLAYRILDQELLEDDLSRRRRRERGS